MPVRPRPLMGLGRGRVLDQEVCAHALSGGDLDGAVLVSVSRSMHFCVCVCVCNDSGSVGTLG